MRFLGTRIHGVLDYVVALVLITAPWALGYSFKGAETWVPVLLGAFTAVYSLMTDYEMGASRVISMRTHLLLDLLSGVLLAASPWLFNFHEYVYLPHVVLGITEIVVSLITKTHPLNEKQVHSATAGR